MRWLADDWPERIWRELTNTTGISRCSGRILVPKWDTRLSASWTLVCPPWVSMPSPMTMIHHRRPHLVEHWIGVMFTEIRQHKALQQLLLAKPRPQLPPVVPLPSNPVTTARE
uniref:Uncharacterized protein n=1 Tax=Cacopsylla melanoneura TaxID=428564 RepID=A0A8D8VAG6_9HEMI